MTDQRNNFVRLLGLCIVVAIGIVTALANGAAPLLVKTVEVIPDSVTFQRLGETAELRAVARDENGKEVGGVVFGWSSTNREVVAVDPHGATATITAVGPGEANVAAVADGVQGVARIWVVPAGG